MKLVIGGAFQGKRQYMMERFGLSEQELTDGAICGWEEIFEAKAVVHLHTYVRRCLEAGRDVSGLAGELLRRNPQVILAANELGSGVVPVDAFDRNYRETAGRLCCALAREAREIHRVVCGIGVVIKDD